MSHRHTRIYDIESISLGVYTPFTELGSVAQTLSPEYCGRVAALLAPGQRVLETSAGTGQLTLELTRTGADVTPVDISPWSWEACARLSGVNRACAPPQPILASAVNLPLLDASFDVVVSGHRFGETGELRSAVIEAHRVLKPGGTLVAVVLTPEDAAFKKGEPETTGVWSFEGTVRHFLAAVNSAS